MLFILAFISVCFADKKEYLSVEYNKGSFEIYEFGKCYCFTDDGCYQYKKKDDKTVTESKYAFNENLKCEGTPTNTDNTIGVADDGLKYTVVKELPKHSLHYFESLKNDCSDEKDRAKVILTDGHCEKNYYEDGAPYNTYTVKEEGGKKTINMKGFNDAECKNKICPNKRSQLEADKCVQIERGGNYGKFISGKYEEEPVEETEDKYLGIEYNVGSIELYELGECYCYEGEICYKYVKKDANKVILYTYENKGYYCPDGAETSKDELDIGKTYTYYSIYRYYKTIPDHEFYHVASTQQNCEDSTPRPINIFTENNCESYISGNSGLYGTYEISGVGIDKKIQYIYYKDEYCETDWTDGEGNYYGKDYKPNNCYEIDSRGYCGRFYLGNYDVRYVGIEYNVGSIEMYELGKCYCFSNDGCYKYIKTGEDKVLEEYYKGVESNCEGTPIPTTYTIGTVHDKDMKFKFYNTIPNHDFHYIVSLSGQCTDTTPRPINIFTEDNCERDYYSDVKRYLKYRISEDGTKVDITQYSDNQCKTYMQCEEATYEADKCLEDKIKFNTREYELSGGKSTILIMMIIFIIFILF